MLKRFQLPCLLAFVVLPATAGQAQYPIMTKIANNVIDKYQNSSCEQLWANRGQQPGAEEQRFIALLNNDSQMRQAFFNQIAGPVVNKLFTCGMIP
jgi:transcription elongation factor GreA-like protein